MRAGQKRSALVVAVAVGAVVLAGCGASSGGSGGGGSDTIKLMVDSTIAPSPAFGGIGFPYPVVGAKAAAKAINDAGGIDGHKIQIDECDNKGDPNQSAVCGRQAISNGDIAVIGAWDIQGAGQILPILQQAKIPYIGALAGQPVEVQNPISFIFDPGAVVSAFGTAQLWIDSGCKHVVLFSPQASDPKQVDAQKSIAQKGGVKFDTVDISTGAADVAPQVSSALGMNPDCMTYEGDGQTTAKLIAGARGAGYKGQFITAIGSLLPPFLASLGPVGDGVKVLNTTLSTDSDDPMVTQFRNEVLAYAGQKDGPQNLNEFAQDGWSSVQLVKQALSGSGEYTAAKLLEKIPTMCDVNVGNVYPHISFCKPVVKSKTYPRIYNAWFRYYVAKDGKYVPLDDQWHDLRSSIPTS